MICAQVSPGMGPRAGARRRMNVFLQPSAPRRQLQHCRRDGFPRSYQRTPAGNRTTARGGVPGFRVVALVRVRKAQASVDSWTVARRLQLRGQPRFHTAFQFKSLAGTLRVPEDNTRSLHAVNLTLGAAVLRDGADDR